MGKILCFISEDFADFEITLLLHKIRMVGKKEVVTVAYSNEIVMSESGLNYKPDISIEKIGSMEEIEGLIIPGGPIKTQKVELTNLILQMKKEKKMIAAICNGPQYLGRAGLLDESKYTTSCSEERIEKLGVEDPFPRSNYINQRVVSSENIITAQGRAFVDFSFVVFEYLEVYKGKEEQKKQLYDDIMNR